MPKRYRKREEEKADPYRVQPLPLHRPVAVYYRQSSEGQIGNINTTLQTVDMVEHLMKQGWVRDQIIMIDRDAGISGTKKITERPGMSYLHTLIENGEIGLVASQDVDRFFRDVTQIQTNIFIDTCRRNNVLVLTPTFVYDFAHPTQGRYHMQMFRDHAQRAADHLEYHIKGRLMQARDYLQVRGIWTGRSVAIGYMVDLREKLPDGTANPQHRHYAPFQPCADVVLAYFKLFREFNRNLSQTWRHIYEHGPCYPENYTELVPPGFRIDVIVKYRGVSGGLMPSPSGLEYMLTNVAYLGHWSYRGVIEQWHNHEAIIPEDLFMYAFNALSKVDFFGEPNPDYTPQRVYVRHKVEDRRAHPATYTGLVYSHSLPGHPFRKVNTCYLNHNDNYAYILADSLSHTVMSIHSKILDPVVDKLLLERLEATTIDDETWREALDGTQQSDQGDVRRIEQDIRAAERAKQTILDNLKTIANPEIVKNLEASYEANDREIARLRVELERVRANVGQHTVMLEARPTLELIIQRWQDVPHQQRRELFEAFARRIIVDKQGDVKRHVVIEWRDGTTSETVFRSGRTQYTLTDIEAKKMVDMIYDQRPQWEILREFPELNWEGIVHRFYHHDNHSGRIGEVYKQPRKYTYQQTWYDTKEYQQTLLIPASSGVLRADPAVRRRYSG
ncbi:MAG: recombinase family protein [Anaerolineae bacterium]|nr:recombinase family protein [Anaerolineae bacterium]